MVPTLIIIHSGTEEDYRELKRYDLLPFKSYDMSDVKEAREVEELYARDSDSKHLPILHWECPAISDQPLEINEEGDQCWIDTYPSLQEVTDGLFFALGEFFLSYHIKKREGIEV